MRFLAVLSSLLINSFTFADINNHVEAMEVFKKITNIINRSAGAKWCQDGSEDRYDYSLARPIDNNDENPCFLKFDLVHTRNREIDAKTTWSIPLMDIDLDTFQHSSYQHRCGKYYSASARMRENEKAVKIEVNYTRSGRRVPYVWEESYFSIRLESSRWSNKLYEHMHNLARFCDIHFDDY